MIFVDSLRCKSLSYLRERKVLLKNIVSVYGRWKFSRKFLPWIIKNLKYMKLNAAWKESKYGNIRFQSKYGKIQARKNSVFGHFSRSCKYIYIYIFMDNKRKSNSLTFLNLLHSRFISILFGLSFLWLYSDWLCTTSIQFVSVLKTADICWKCI